MSSDRPAATAGTAGAATARAVTAGTAGAATARADIAAATIEVVVVTWNSARVLPELLRSLPAGLAGVRWRLTVADNASTDGTVATARGHLPSCRVVQTGRNAGYAGAVNAALAGAEPYDAALILNPDVRLGPGSVAAMYRGLGRHGPRTVGITVPRMTDADGHVARSLRREPTVTRALGEAALGRRAGWLARLGETVLDEESYRRPTVADWATGAAMLVSAGCLAACGPWDESFFLYSEETDFALRARDLGFATVLVPQAEAVHLGGESATSPVLWSLLVRNRVRLYRKRHSSAATAAFWVAVFLREAARAVLLGHPRSRRAAVVLLRPSTLEVDPRTGIRLRGRAANGGRHG